MISSAGSLFVCALFCAALPYCKSSPDETPKAASAAPRLAVPATASGSAAASSDEADFCRAQGYKRRCDPACKAAHVRAISKACVNETRTFTLAVPNQKEFSACLVACRKPTTEKSTCVGAPDREGCACQLQCYASLPPDVIEKAKEATRCYNRELASACE